MIHEVEGDLLLSKAQAIAHGVAPNDDFHSGLALSLREQWPAMYKDFRHYCQTMHPRPGEAWTWAGTGGARIVSLFTQEAAYEHGRMPGKAHVTHVNKCLRELRHLVDKEHFASLAVPRLATGVGGLDWAEVRPLLDHHLGDLPIPVLVYATFRKGVQAVEPGL